jgi:hypothetical protein
VTEPETQRWAKRLGVDVSKKRSWRLDIILLTSGELPTDTVPALAPYFSLIVTEWMSHVEKTLGVRFRRERPFIRSTVKGGAKAVVAWLVT